MYSRVAVLAFVLQKVWKLQDVDSWQKFWRNCSEEVVEAIKTQGNFCLSIVKQTLQPEK